MKKATTKAISYCTKISGLELGKSTSWARLSEILMDDIEWDLKTDPRKDTVIKLIYSDTTEEIHVENAIAYDNKACDWNWDRLYQIIVEHLIDKKWKSKSKNRGKSKKKAESVPTKQSTESPNIKSKTSSMAGSKTKKPKSASKTEKKRTNMRKK